MVTACGYLLLIDVISESADLMYILIWVNYREVGLGAIENSTLRVYDYWNRVILIIATILHWNISFTTISREQHHNTCVPLETAIASLPFGVNLWVSIVVIGTNLITTQYYSTVMCITWQYSVIYCTCKCENISDTDIAGPNIARCW